MRRGCRRTPHGVTTRPEASVEREGKLATARGAEVLEPRDRVLDGRDSALGHPLHAEDIGRRRFEELPAAAQQLHVG